MSSRENKKSIKSNGVRTRKTLNKKNMKKNKKIQGSISQA